MSKVHDVFTNRDLPLEVTCYILRISDEQLKGGLAMPHAGGLLDASSLALRGSVVRPDKKISFELHMCIYTQTYVCGRGFLM